MIRRNSRALLVVAPTVAALLVLLAGLAVNVGRPYPGFFVAPDFRVFPAEPGVPLQWGDRIYAGAFALGSLAALTFVALTTMAPELLAHGWIYPISVATLFTFAALSFPIKIAALLDTRRRAASPLVNQQITVLLLGIGLGLGGWLLCSRTWGSASSKASSAPCRSTD